MGQYGFFYRITAWLPLLGSFRFPCRYLVLFQLAAAVLAAIGFLLLVRESSRARQRRGSARSSRHSRSGAGHVGSAAAVCVLAAAVARLRAALVRRRIVGGRGGGRVQAPPRSRTWPRPRDRVGRAPAIGGRTLAAADRLGRAGTLAALVGLILLAAVRPGLVRHERLRLSPIAPLGASTWPRPRTPPGKPTAAWSPRCFASTSRACAPAT